MCACADEAERRQYEEWLEETQHLLQMQQGYLEQQIAGHRKAKRAMSAKQRSAKKAGRPVTEDELTQLRGITQQQAAVQKQLEQVTARLGQHSQTPPLTASLEEPKDRTPKLTLYSPLFLPRRSESSRKITQS